MFLNPTAYPTPRLTLSPWVTFPAPPGSRITSAPPAGRSVGQGHRLESLEQLGDRGRALHGLPGRQARALDHRVPQPQLDRIEVERGGEPVHLRLVGEARLHRAEPAHGAAGRVVGVHDVAVDRRVRADVRPDGEAGRVRDDSPRARRVGAAVEHDPRADEDELAVTGRAVLVLHARGVAVDVPEERLLAAVHELHGPVRVQGEQAGVDLHREILARTERPSDARERDPHALGRQVEARRELVAVDVQPLGRDVEVDAALAVGHREARLGSEERLVLHPDLVLALARRRPPRPRRRRHGGCARSAAGSRPGAAPASRAASRFSASSTTGSSSYSTSMRAAARLAVSGWSAATSATASPW